VLTGFRRDACDICAFVGSHVTLIFTDVSKQSVRPALKGQAIQEELFDA
jgi:hypothetical protein